MLYLIVVAGVVFLFLGVAAIGACMLSSRASRQEERDCEFIRAQLLCNRNVFSAFGVPKKLFSGDENLAFAEAQKDFFFREVLGRRRVETGGPENCA